MQSWTLLCRSLSDATPGAPTLDLETLELWANESGWVDLPSNSGLFELAAMDAGGRWRSGLAWIPAGDVEALTRAAMLAEVSTPRGIYLSTAPFTAAKRSADTLAMVTELVFDLDAAEGVHAEGNLPTLAQALDFACEVPAPTFNVTSGGGLHLRYVLNEPAPRDRFDEVRELQKNMRSVLEAWGARLQVEVDTKPTMNLVGVLRLPGSVNRKGANVPVEVTDVSRPYDLEELARAFAQLAPPPALAAPAPSEPAKARVGRGNTVKERFAAAVAPSALLPLLEPGVRVSGDRVTFPRSDGSYSSDPSVSLTRGSNGVELLHFFGERVLKEMAIAGCFPSGKKPKNFDSFTWILHKHCKGNWAVAARIVERFETSRGVFNLEGLVGALHAAGGDPGALSAQFPPVAAPTLEEQFAEQINLDEAPAVKRTAVRAAENGEPFEVMLGPMVPTRVTVSRDPKTHGIWEIQRVATAEEPERKQLITDYVVCRTGIFDVLRLDSDGNPQPARDLNGMPTATYDVTFIDSRGRTETLHRVSQIDSLNIDKLTQSVRRLSVSTPTSPSARAIVRAALERLDREQISASQVYAQTGWIREEGGNHVYALPGGSIDRQGSRSDVVVGSGATGAAATSSQSMLSVVPYAEIPDAARTIPQALAHLLALGEPRAVIPALGQVLAGVLPLERLGTMVLVGRHGSGKSLLAQAAATMMSSAPFDGKSFLFTFGGGNTTAGFNRLLGWTRHQTLVADDMRVFADSRVNDTVRQQYTTLAQAAYGTAAPTKSNAALGQEDSPIPALAALVTSEISPAADDEGIRSRAHVVKLGQGDVRTGQRGEASPITRYARFVEDNPLAARGLGGLCVQALAALMSESGAGVREVRRRFEGMRAAHVNAASDLVSAGDSRALEVGSTWMLGWDLLELAARSCRDSELSAGLLAVIPSPETRAQLFRQLISENASQISEGSFARTLLAKLFDKLTGKEGYLVHANGRNPYPEEWAIMGWDDTSHGIQHRQNALYVGILSSDRTHVHLTRGAVEAAKVSIGAGSMRADKVAELLAELTVSGSPKPTRPPASLFGPVYSKAAPGFTMSLGNLVGEPGFTFPPNGFTGEPDIQA